MERLARASIGAALCATLAALPLTPARADDGYVIVAPRCNPEQLYLCTDPAERVRMEAEKKRLDAQRQAEAQAAEAARRQREAEIKDIMRSMNLPPGREADARRIYEMRRAAQAAMPRLPTGPDPMSAPETCPTRREYDEVVMVRSQREASREAALASVTAQSGVSDTRCDQNDFGWQCSGQRKTGVKKYACVGSAAQ
jgi:hypothetical protein